MATQTKIIGASTLIVSISLLLVWFAGRSDFKVDFSSNLTCSGDCINPQDSDCIGYFNITSLSKKFYIKNNGNMNLPFTEPEKVKSFQIYRADLRYKTNNPNRWKAINLSKGMTLNVNQTNEFRINLCKKNPEDDIKYGVKVLNINEDPIFFGEKKISFVQDCKTITNLVDIPIYKDISYDYSYIYIDNSIKPSTKINKTEVRYRTEKTGEYVYFENKTICNKIGYKIEDEEILFTKDFKCLDKDEEICCFSCRDGDCNVNNFDYAKSRLTNIGGWTGYCIDTKTKDSIKSNSGFSKLVKYDK